MGSFLRQPISSSWCVSICRAFQSIFMVSQAKENLTLFTMTHLLQLGLDLDADAAAVRLAYRSLQRIVHPDIAGELLPP